MTFRGATHVEDVSARLVADRHLCEADASLEGGLLLMLGMVVWDLHYRASARER
uniref:hypothetical protein n=1 Tax=Streptomyces anthocyanicus TaxID=68174 RepID=UPI002F913B1D